MKRFIVSLLAATVFAQDNTETETAETEGDLKEKAEAVGDWFSQRQEAVEFTTTADGECTLAGNYHWYKNIGVDGAVIRHTVSDCDIADGARVLTWAEIEDPDTPGNIEGFYCTITFSQINASARETADVETQTGTGVDYAAFNAIPRLNWCTPQGPVDGVAPVCERQSVSQWQILGSDAQTNYPISYNAATSKGEATCSAHRILSTPSNYMELKTATPYTFTSGYKIYNTMADYDNGIVGFNGSGAAQEFTLEGASTLFAGAAMLTATLLA